MIQTARDRNKENWGYDPTGQHSKEKQTLNAPVWYSMIDIRSITLVCSLRAASVARSELKIIYRGLQLRWCSKSPKRKIAHKMNDYCPSPCDRAVPLEFRKLPIDGDDAVQNGCMCIAAPSIETGLMHLNTIHMRTSRKKVGPAWPTNRSR